MIDRLQNMCSTTSQSDFAVITTEIIYFYDDKASLTSGSCKSVHYSTLFSGYSDLPGITHWKAVLTVSQSYVDVYTGITKKQENKDTGKTKKLGSCWDQLHNCNSPWVEK